MSDQESERPGGTLPGLKKSDLLSRQTGDGSFEFIVESGSPEGYDSEVSGGLSDDLPLPPRSVDKKRAGLIGAGVLLVIVLIGAVFAFARSGNAPEKADAQVDASEVAGFKPYGGGEVAPRVERSKAERRVEPQRVVKPIVKPQEVFSEEVEEMPPNAEPVPEEEWQLGEAEEIEEEDDGTRVRPRRSMARDRVNFGGMRRHSIQTESLRELSIGDHKENIEREERSSRRIQRQRRVLQRDDSVEEVLSDEQDYESDDEFYEDESIEESDYEEQYFEEEDEVAPEIIY